MREMMVCKTNDDRLKVVTAVLSAIYDSREIAICGVASKLVLHSTIMGT